ncbi:gfo/Idh/MocA family oxidoreductase [bacterium]|nr:MAG: gfo/Idh/MocA family oxidoreductase [bacterium]
MNNTKPVRVAVVGAGYLGRFHAQKYAALDGAELIAVVDTNAERAAAVAAECGCEAHGDLATVTDRIDAASVVVPTSGHHDVALPLLTAGKHLLLEKPIAPSLAEADAIVAAAATAGVILQVGHLERFNPAIRELVGRVKQPLFIEAHRLSGFSGRATDVDIVVDLMIHDIDILLALVDDRVTDVQAVGAPVITGQVDIANARLEFSGGCCANLTASRVSTQDMRKFRVFQPGGFMSADCARQTNQIVMRGPDDAIVPEMYEHERADNLMTEIEAFLAAVRGERQPEVSGDAGREALRVALAVTADIERRLGQLDQGA